MNRPIHKLLPFLVAVFMFFVLPYSTPTHGQKLDRLDRGRAMDMLKTVKNAIKKDYYDPQFKGIDIDARFKVAEEKLKTAETLGQAFGIIAQAVMDLNDSHTRFYPPSRAGITEYGWRMQIFGDKAVVTGVRENSDAQKKGLKVGDEVLKLNGFTPTRSEMWKMIYYYNILSPRPSLALEVKSPEGTVREMVVAAKQTKLKRKVDLNSTIDLNEAFREGDKLKNLDRHYFKEVGNTMVWKMPTFVFDEKQVGGLVSRARGKQNLVIDLRGNSGGYVVTLEQLVGYFFDKDLKIADLKGRKPMDPQRAKTQGSKVFPGKVFVLVDSNSASASEIFARLMQLENRGIVIGDISAGAVMQSRGEGFEMGVDTVLLYGMNLTHADVIMSDGKSLEHVGVIPDEIVIPTGKDLAERRDPAMARALELAGNPIDPAVAGKFFPVEPFIERTSNLAFTWD